jgi:hypothetical protein
MAKPELNGPEIIRQSRMAPIVAHHRFADIHFTFPARGTTAMMAQPNRETV